MIKEIIPEDQEEVIKDVKKRIIITSEEDLERFAKNAHVLLRNYVECVAKWRTEYGSKNKNNMDYWQARSLEFLRNPFDFLTKGLSKELEYNPEDKIEYDKK